MQQLEIEETEDLLHDVRRSLDFRERNRGIGPTLVDPYMDLTDSEGDLSHSTGINNIDNGDNLNYIQILTDWTCTRNDLIRLTQCARVLVVWVRPSVNTRKK